MLSLGKIDGGDGVDRAGGVDTPSYRARLRIGSASIEYVAEHRGARRSLPRNRRIADSNVGDGRAIPGIVGGERPAHAARRRKQEAFLRIHDGQIGILHKDRRTLDLGRRFGPERLAMACCTAIA